MANHLVTYYTRSGTAKKAAEYIAQRLSADLEIIRPVRQYTGLGTLRGIIEVFKKFTPAISPDIYDASKYGRIILVTPIWAENCPPPVRSYIRRNKEKMQEICLVSVASSSGCETVIKTLGADFGLDISHSLSLTARHTKSAAYKEASDAFISLLTTDTEE